MAWVLGFDVSFSRLDRRWWSQLPSWGPLGPPRVLVQNLWPGGWAASDVLQAVAEANLRDARLAGMITAAYLVASPWYGADLALREARRRAGHEWRHLSALFVDVETLEWQGRTYFPSQDQTWEMLEACAATGLPVGLYTGRWFWVGYYGDDARPWWRHWPLWNALYTPEPRTGDPGYGPWRSQDVVGVQFQGGVNMAGVEVDVNVFREDFFRGASKVRVPWRSHQGVEEKEVGLEEAVMGMVRGEVPLPLDWGQKVPLWLNGTPWVEGDQVEEAARPTVQEVLEAAFWFLRRERPRLLRHLESLQGRDEDVHGHSSGP